MLVTISEKDETKGISGFWLTIFKNVDMLSEMIQPNDEPILNHLQDIKVEFKEKDPMVGMEKKKKIIKKFFFNSVNTAFI